MIGKIAWWTLPNTNNRGHGFIEVQHTDHTLEKFFVLGSRVLFEGRPAQGTIVEFDISPEKPRRPNGYRLAENVKIIIGAEKEPKAGA